MPAKKSKPKAKPTPKKKAAKAAPPEKKSGGGFVRLLVSKPVRQIIITGIIIALLAVFWGRIEEAFDNLFDTVGYGLIFFALAILFLVFMTWRRKIGRMFYRWNLVLGGIAFIMAVWGIMGLNNAGGSFGWAIIGNPSPLEPWADVGSLFIIIGYAAAGIILVIPGLIYRGITRAIDWTVELFQRRPARVATDKPHTELPPPHRVIEFGNEGREKTSTRPVAEKPPLPSDMDKPLVPPEVASSRQKLEELADRAAALKPGTTPPTAAPPGKPDLRQVAEDVWKKYGQAMDLVTIDGWRLPPVDILDTSPEVQFSQADNLMRAKLIEESLASYGVDAKVVQINTGPTVTQFGIEPGWDRKFKEIRERDRDGNVQVRTEEISKTRVKVDKITSLSNDLALALAASSIRIEAPVPGKSIVGIEVPNTTSDMVSLRGVVETSVFQKLEAKTKMALALGKGAGGEAVAADLTKMPHLLVAGATGSGKTVCLNTIICCLLMHNTPNDVRFILIDPKRVELTQYNSIPHLATPVIVDTNKAMGALRWLSEEMDKRYQKLAASGARHIEGYNKDRQGADKLPYLVLIIDELADLMMAGFDEVESNLCRLAQLARATGIHLVVATQRPSVDVVTGLIKANFPTRISFAVTSQVDSRTILDGAGAEKLLGRGDMLYMPTEASKPKRLQGCFLSDAEIDRLVYFWGSQQPEQPDKLRMETLVAATPAGTIGGHPRDPLLEQARELAREHESISTSFLQRRLHIGYPRAARLMEQLEAVMQKEMDTRESRDELSLEDEADST